MRNSIIFSFCILSSIFLAFCFLTFLGCADARKLEFPPNNFDLIFSNWLLMYFNEEELLVFISQISHWLIPGGYLFFRESCNTGIRGVVSNSNDTPAIYRDSLFYAQLFESTGDFELVHHGNVKLYEEFYGYLLLYFLSYFFIEILTNVFGFGKELKKFAKNKKFTILFASQE
jgi:hypothetical protein